MNTAYKNLLNAKREIDEAIKQYRLSYLIPQHMYIVTKMFRIGYSPINVEGEVFEAGDLLYCIDENGINSGEFIFTRVGVLGSNFILNNRMISHLGIVIEEGSKGCT